MNKDRDGSTRAASACWSCGLVRRCASAGKRRVDRDACPLFVPADRIWRHRRISAW